MSSLNPFRHRGPITDPSCFFGRMPLVEEVVEAILKRQGVAISGGPKIGKSSFVQHVLHVLRQEHPEVVRVDFNCNGWNQESRDDLQSILIEALDRSMQSDVVDHPPSLRFGEFLQALRTRARDRGPIVFVLDELDRLARNSELIGSDFFAGLRNVSEQRLATFVFTTTLPLSSSDFAAPSVLASGILDPAAMQEGDAIRDLDEETGLARQRSWSTALSPLGNQCHHVAVPLLDDAEARALIVGLAAQGGVNFAGLVDFLLELAGSHPLYLQIAGSCAFTYCMAQGITDGAGITDEGRKEIRQRFVREVLPAWRSIWRKLRATDRKYLRFLAVEQGRDAGVVERLRQFGIVREVAREGETRLILVSPGFARFVSQQLQPAIQVAPPVIVDNGRGIILVGESKLDLKSNEHGFKFLELLTREPERLFSFREVVDHIWADRDYGPGRQDQVKTLAQSVRTKIKEATKDSKLTKESREYIVGGPVEGYRFIPDRSW